MLVFLQLLIVGAVISGTREQDTSVQRLNSVRAFYAAEGGVNMAIREFMAGGGAGSDFDGDTIVGSISDNSDASDNPALGTARVVVSRTALSGQGYNVSSDATAGNCRSRIRATVAIDLVGGRRVIYCSWSNSFPQYRIWTGSAWGPPANTLDFGAKQYWAVMRRCPIRTEVATVCSLQNSVLTAAIQKGMTWGDLITVTTDCGTIRARPFFFAYEQNSGDGLLVYRRQNFSTIYYRTWNGTAWSGENSFASPISGKPLFMKLVPRRNSDEMMLIVCDDRYDIAAMTWNGSSFANEITLETNYPNLGPTIDNETMDAAYEGSSGRCMVIWGRSGDSQPQYRIWDGAAWQAQAAAPPLNGVALWPVPAVTGIPVWPHLASDRASNKLMFGVLDNTNDVTVNIWNGSTWETNLKVESNAPTVGSRCFDVAFEPSGTRGLVMWGRSPLSQPRYRVYNGSTWSSEAQGPALPNTTLLVQMTPSRNGSEIMILHNASGGQNALQFMRWDGSNLLHLQELESNLSGPAGAEVFMIPDDPEGIIDPMRVWTWAPAEP